MWPLTRIAYNAFALAVGSVESAHTAEHTRAVESDPLSNRVVERVAWRAQQDLCPEQLEPHDAIRWPIASQRCERAEFLALRELTGSGDQQALGVCQRQAGQARLAPRPL
jgi:hypothetical protein